MILGLSGRQAIPITIGILALAVVLQTGLHPLIGVIGPLLGITIAIGKWRSAPLTDTLIPGSRLNLAKTLRRHRWVRPPLVGDNTNHTLPGPLRGLELIEHGDSQRRGIAFVRDRQAGTLTVALRIHGHGFPLASAPEQDTMLTSWAAALSPFARERSPITTIAWHEWAHPVTSAVHADFLHTVGVTTRATNPAVADYQALIAHQAPVTVAHDVLVTVTASLRKIRSRRSHPSRLRAAIETLTDEVRLFTGRLEAAGLTVDPPLDAIELSAAVRVRSNPARGPQIAALTRSLAAAAHRGCLEWGPMVVEADWTHTRIDGAFHRSYRIAAWPQLPVGSDWMNELLTSTRAIRTVTVVLEPVPMGRAARAADREVMSREADADMKTQKGFRVNARERKRLTDVETRERELSEGHAKFQFVGIIDVTAPDLDTLDDACADVEQAAAQSLLDLRPLDARHELGWLATLPLGRALTRRTQ